MHEELWLTGIFNNLLAGPANAVLNAVNFPAKDPAHPWTNWLVCEIVVVAFMIVFFGIVRSRFSVDKPGKVQHVLELTYEFFHASSEEVVGHGGARFLPFFGTIFLFILLMNLIGLIPGFESPTMFPMVPLGLAVS